MRRERVLLLEVWQSSGMAQDTWAGECSHLLCPFCHLWSNFLLTATIDKVRFQTLGLKTLAKVFSSLFIAAYSFFSNQEFWNSFRWLIISNSVHIPQWFRGWLLPEIHLLVNLKGNLAMLDFGIKRSLEIIDSSPLVLQMRKLGLSLMWPAHSLTANLWPSQD